MLLEGRDKLKDPLLCFEVQGQGLCSGSWSAIRRRVVVTQPDFVLERAAP